MGYLEAYAEREERYGRLIDRLKVTLKISAAVLIVGGSLFLWFKNYRQEARVDEFLSVLRQGNYEAAYAFWGCTIEKPCNSYSYQDFLEDWGPNSKIGKVSSFRVGRSQERGTGVIVAVRINDREPVSLWVEKQDGTVGFAPPF
jgi:hypothetical protein